MTLVVTSSMSCSLSEAWHRCDCLGRLTYLADSLVNEFKDLIFSLNKNKFKFTVIALQEVWSVPNGSTYNLDGYKPFHFTIRDMSGMSPNSGGGVGCFIDENFEFEPLPQLSMFEKGVFESQFIKLKTSKTKFSIIGNIYRGNSYPLADINKFNEILENLLTLIDSDPLLKKAEEVQIVGDHNIDLLKYKVHGHTATYVDNLLSHGVLPLINYPTR